MSDYASAIPAVGLRDALADFAAKMEWVLRCNDHKGGWDDFSVFDALKRLQDEVGELNQAVGRALDADLFHEDHLREKVVQEAADVANFAMMVADLARNQKNGWLRATPPRRLKA